ncbi:spore germination protein [Alteribacillus bidgolensis]|uniref:Spore germination protein KA n=1 Tax=Alteribacillus bidgolensis TaxID=930129 RepID=A0A1G8H6P8_9BACI|nr:spore germination protein [Alteribacillus bidgolensis]SDI02318.1 spore germination protein KA [Alteribacillus bidgolensis]
MGFKRKRKLKNILKKSLQAESNVQSSHSKETQQSVLHDRLQENVEEITRTLGSSTDVVTRVIYIGQDRLIKAGIIYLDGLVNNESIRDLMGALRAPVREIEEKDEHHFFCDQVVEVLKEGSLSAENTKKIDNFDSLFASVLSGDTAILFDGQTEGIMVNTKGGDQRAVTEPVTEQAVRGPQEGFTENLRTNTSLVRRKIENPNLWLETKRIGRSTKTAVAIMYINGIVNDKIVEEVRRRLARIDIDSVLESGYIEELIQDETFTPFPTMFNSERPDVVAAKLLEGRVALLVNGTPFVLTAPATFIEYFQVNEDYYQRATIGTFLRFLRIGAFFTGMLAPSLYIALTAFHQEMIPTPLLISLAAQREGIPFPVFVEALLMETIFEVLREAGTRMPKAAGQAVSIVGTFVIGIAAVEAGLVSAGMVIIVSLTAISTFVMPSYDMGIAVRLLRFPMMFLAAIFGLFGIFIGLMALVLHTANLRSFGVPYMVPFGPFIAADQKDALFRLPWRGMFSRPRLISQKNIVREDKPLNSKPDSRHEPKE